ncbi:hypothetical protein NECAME_10960 [Necator americanus]|uniref:Uncharacterized protein n=1 Tax=Necator americanus TaxID=51031 RepID=W2T7G9_NECAM|nr:hypothetical protein NECAME_10960 [Necator americanus]ETN77579.1 hypothetical protein NECAME_10960 [Necator americanus]
MDIREAPKQPLWRSAYLYIVAIRRRTLLALIMGFMTITAGTTFLVIRYRKKVRKELEQKKLNEDEEEQNESEESERVDVTPPSENEANIDESSKSPVSVDSSKSDKVSKSPEKEEKRTSIDGTLLRTPFIEKNDSKVDGTEKTGTALDSKDILPSISLEDENGTPAVRRQEEGSSSSLSVSMSRYRIPERVSAPSSVGNSSVSSGGVTEQEIKRSIVEKITVVSSEPVSRSSTEKIASKEISDSKEMPKKNESPKKSVTKLSAKQRAKQKKKAGTSMTLKSSSEILHSSD